MTIMLPNFLIIGAMNAGTTSLHSYLATHPEIFMSITKEPNFFSSEKNWSKGVGWYESFFTRRKNEKAVGESSVNYTKYPYYGNVPERIASLVPNMKLIYVVRNPVDRIYSHYLHNVYAGIETDPIEKALAERPLYTQASLYYMQIEQYLEHFPRENIMILFLDEMKTDPISTVQGVFDFLDVDSSFVPPNIGEIKHQTKAKRGRDNMLMRFLQRTPFYTRFSHMVPEGSKKLASFIFKTKSADPAPLSARLREKLISELAPDIEKLSRFLGLNILLWFTPHDRFGDGLFPDTNRNRFTSILEGTVDPIKKRYGPQKNLQLGCLAHKLLKNQLPD